MSTAQSLDEWCPNCGRQTKRLNNYTGWCNDCSTNDPYIQVEYFLEKNADHIEHYLAQGKTFFEALVLIREDYRPTCLCCGEFIKRAPRSSQFCTRTAKCRAARDRYHYLHKRRNFTKSQALALVISELATK